jgi:hypothetical protein
MIKRRKIKMKKLISISTMMLMGVLGLSSNAYALGTYKMISLDKCNIEGIYTSYNTYTNRMSISAAEEILCDLPNEYMSGYYDQIWQTSQSNEEYVATYVTFVSGASFQVRVCEIKNDPSVARECGNAVTVSASGWVTLYRSTDYPYLSNLDGAPVLLFTSSYGAVADISAYWTPRVY